MGRFTFTTVCHVFCFNTNLLSSLSWWGGLGWGGGLEVGGVGLRRLSCVGWLGFETAVDIGGEGAPVELIPCELYHPGGYENKGM